MFKDSAYEKLTPYRFFEKSTRPPRVFPVYLGDGMNVMSIDATGLQGMNFGVPNYCADPTIGDMYVVRNGMIGDQITPVNHAPLGWMDWEIRFEGQHITARNFEDCASNWKRTLFIDEARVETEFILCDRLKVRVDVFMPYGRNAMIVEPSVCAYDHSNQPVAEAFAVQMDLNWHFDNRRSGVALSKVTFCEGTAQVVTPGHETYEWTLSTGCADARLVNDVLIRSFTLNAGNDFDRTVAVYAINGEIEDSIETLRVENLRAWHSYFDSVATIEGITDEELFLYHNALYLFRACFSPRLGYSIGFPFNFPPYWHASVFWDSAFVMDGLMRAGDKAAADAFMDFLYEARRPALKPYVWMCLYDGTPTVNEAHDIAPLVLAAHATTAMRYYEYYGERLADRVLPIMEAVVQYALEKLFAQENGRWILAQKVSHDVGDADEAELNQTYTHIWFLSVLDKYAEYMKLINREVDPRIPQILTNYHVETRGGEYAHSRGVTAEESRNASWVPFLLYPTDAQPFVDMDLFARTRAKNCFIDLYMRKQGSFQPWTAMLQMLSDLRLGDRELAWSDYGKALDYVYGAGLFSEIGPHQQTGGLPPYITAEGTYLTATLYPMVRSSVRGSELGLFDGLDGRHRERPITVRNVQVMQNAKVSAALKAGSLRADIKGDLKGVRVVALVPKALKPDEIRVLVDGVPQAFEVETATRERANYVRFHLPDGAKTIFIG